MTVREIRKKQTQEGREGKKIGKEERKQRVSFVE